MKILKKLGIEGMCLNTMQAIYENNTDSIIMNEEKLKSFHLRLGT
jgi:hypothetical protein